MRPMIPLALVMLQIPYLMARRLDKILASTKAPKKSPKRCPTNRRTFSEKNQGSQNGNEATDNGSVLMFKTIQSGQKALSD